MKRRNCHFQKAIHHVGSRLMSILDRTIVSIFGNTREILDIFIKCSNIRSTIRLYLRGTRLSIFNVPWILSPCFPRRRVSRSKTCAPPKSSGESITSSFRSTVHLKGCRSNRQLSSSWRTTLSFSGHLAPVNDTRSSSEAACFRSSAALIAFQVGGSGRTIEKWGIIARKKLSSCSSIFFFHLIVIKNNAIKSSFEGFHFSPRRASAIEDLICYFKSLDSFSSQILRHSYMLWWLGMCISNIVFFKF